MLDSCLAWLMSQKYIMKNLVRRFRTHNRQSQVAEPKTGAHGRSAHGLAWPYCDTFDILCCFDCAAATGTLALTSKTPPDIVRFQSR